MVISCADAVDLYVFIPHLDAFRRDSFLSTGLPFDSGQPHIGLGSFPLYWLPHIDLPCAFDPLISAYSIIYNAYIAAM